MILFLDANGTLEGVLANSTTETERERETETHMNRERDRERERESLSDLSGPLPSPEPDYPSHTHAQQPFSPSVETWKPPPPSDMLVCSRVSHSSLPAATGVSPADHTLSD